MNFNEQINEMKTFYNLLLDFLDIDNKSNVIFDKLNEMLTNQNFMSNKQELKSFLLLIQNVSHDHIRNNFFYDKIFRLLRILFDYMEQIHTYIDIFNIFKSDKKILMFLMTNKFIIFDSRIKNQLKERKFIQRFFTEYLNVAYEQREDIIQKLKCGENDNLICEYIRNDSIVEFVRYITYNNISIENYKIPSSIFETNSYLLKNKPNLIEYAAFFGSIRIFKYLLAKGAELSPKLWDYAVHSRNSKIIHLLEDQNVEPSETCIKESIKCHHNELVRYLINRRVNEEEKVDILALKYRNYEFIPTEFADDESTFDVFIASLLNEYYFIAKHILLSPCKFDINKTVKITRKEQLPEFKLDCLKKTEPGYENIWFEKDIIEWIENFKLLDESFIPNVIKNLFLPHHYDERIECVSALHIAIEMESIDIIKLLLEKPEINVNQICIRNYSQNTIEKLSPLHLAIECKNKSFDIVKLLCQVQNVDVNIKALLCHYFYYGAVLIKATTPIHDAIASGNHEIVDFLSQHPRIDINEISKYEMWYRQMKFRYKEQTPLVFAIESQYFYICKSILSNQHVDVNRGIIEFYKIYEGRQCHKFKERKAPLHTAIQMANIDFVDLLLSNENLDVNALYLFESVKTFSRRDKERKKQIKSPIYMAINISKDMADRLLSTLKVDLKLGLLNIGAGRELFQKDAPICKLYHEMAEKLMKQNKMKKLTNNRGRLTNIYMDLMNKLVSDAFYNGGEIEEEDIIDDLDVEYTTFEDVEPGSYYDNRYDSKKEFTIDSFLPRNEHEEEEVETFQHTIISDSKLETIRYLAFSDEEEEF